MINRLDPRSLAQLKRDEMALALESLEIIQRSGLKWHNLPPESLRCIDAAINQVRAAIRHYEAVMAGM